MGRGNSWRGTRGPCSVGAHGVAISTWLSAQEEAHPPTPTCFDLCISSTFWGKAVTYADRTQTTVCAQLGKPDHSPAALAPSCQGSIAN